MWGGFPKANEPCSGYLIQHGEHSILMDCGSGVLMKLQNYIDLNELHHVFLSHYHSDHYSDLGAFLYSRLVNTQIGRVNQKLMVYGPNDENVKQKIEEIPYCNFNEINEQCKIHVGPFEISFVKNIHPVEAYSTKIECDRKSITIITDTGYREEFVSFAKNTDLLLIECSLYDNMRGNVTGHLTSREAGKLARQINPKKVILTHLPHYGNLDELIILAKEEGFPYIELAVPGTVNKV